MRIIFKIFLISIIFLSFKISPTFAYQCEQPRSFSEELAQSSVIFVGKVTQIVKIEPYGTPEGGPSVRFEVKRVYKGNLGKTVDIRVNSIGVLRYGSCGIYLKEGETYLVYASGKPLSTNICKRGIGSCNRTRALKDALEDLATLGNEVTASIPISSPQPSTTTGSNPASPTTPQSLNGKSILSVGFPLKSGHKLYMKYDDADKIVPRWPRLFDLETSSGDLTQVRTIDDLSRLTDQISTQEQALAFAKFLTSNSTRSLLKPTLFSGIEPSGLHVQIPNSLARLLSPTSVKQANGQWVIERDLLLYPELQTPARLIRTYEVISQTGVYTFSVKQVLASGDEVNKLLPYYQ